MPPSLPFPFASISSLADFKATWETHSVAGTVNRCLLSSPLLRFLQYLEAQFEFVGQYSAVQADHIQLLYLDFTARAICGLYTKKLKKSAMFLTQLAVPHVTLPDLADFADLACLELCRPF